MANTRLKVSSSNRSVKEKVEPEQFVISEVREQHFQQGVKTGARIVWITTTIIAAILILVFLVAAFIAIPEWRPYLPEFFELVGKAFEGVANLFK
jgi:hypothetical protein